MSWAAARAAALIPLMLGLLLATARAQTAQLGTIEFPTSARSPQAQAQFLRGVAAMHSFWYPVALDAFRAAQRIEPDFAMAYWGEAMAHNHPIWGDPQETAAARQVLSRLPASATATPRERGYIDAAKALYGDGEKPARDRAHAAAMERLHRAYPSDLEAAAFHALSLLGVAYGGGAGADAGPERTGEALRLRMHAGAIAQDVLRQQPRHPGAAHYILHAFDDPDHAILGLDAALKYAQIAPAAPHALHMPSHIFLQLGRWPDVVASNEAAWRASTRESVPDFHSLHWLLYGLLQQQRPSDAQTAMVVMRDALAKVPPSDARNQAYGRYLLAAMSATYLIETGQWQRAGEVLAGTDQRSDGGQAAMAALAASPAIYARGYAAAMTGKGDPQAAVAELEAIRQQIAGSPIPFARSLAPVLEIQARQLEAVASAARGRKDEALASARRAADLESRLPVPPGPPPQIKPSYELSGEMLLAGGSFEEAAQAFATALYRHPNRTLSVIGARQAASARLALR